MIIVIFLFSAWLANTGVTVAGQEASTKSLLKGLNARKALEIANQLRWSNKEVVSYINTREMVFKFPDDRIERIPLPENEVMVALAPYIKNTHD